MDTANNIYDCNEVTSYIDTNLIDADFDTIDPYGEIMLEDEQEDDIMLK